MAANPRVCELCNIVFDKTDTTFCSPKCEKRASLKKERLRRAELFIKHGLTGKPCGLNKYPGESCGMYAYIAENQLPDGNTTLTISECCGLNHAAYCCTLDAFDMSTLETRALMKKLERYRDASMEKMKVITNQLKAMKLNSKL
ncbi:gamma b protein [Ligustrum mosaic virus]|nr:gamma b protein [Ligustrum mosaic virus]